MIEGVEIKKIDQFKDDRGWLMEVFRNDELAAQWHPEMAYVSMTRPGVKRGPHEHKEQADVFVFIGPGTFELNLWDNRENSATVGEHQKIEVGEENPTLVIVPPGVVHGYKNISGKEAWCLNFPNKLYKGEGKKAEVDEIRHEEDDSSKFTM